MSIKELKQGQIFELKGKIWEVIGFSKDTIRVISENDEMSSLPINCEIIVEVA